MFWLVVAALPCIAAIAYVSKQYFGGEYCYLYGRLDGKVAVVTGASGGIGLETTAELARRGCTVIMASRNMTKLKEAKSQILEMYSDENGKSMNIATNEIKSNMSVINENQLILLCLDLTSFQSIGDFAEKFEKLGLKIDFLICNAGIMTCPYAVTSEGFESQMGTNHIGHCLLTELLLPNMNKTSNCKIILVSSLAHLYGNINLQSILMKERNYHRIKAYMNSKLANCLYAKYLSIYLDKGGNGITCVSLHPGVVRTELDRYLPSIVSWTYFLTNRLFTKSAWEGCQTTLYCVMEERKNLKPGGYYADCKETKCNQLVNNEHYVEEFMQVTYKAMKGVEKFSDLTEKLDKLKFYH